eukprot:jgi/Mesvir1/24338/Mv11018-RA.1
MHVASARKPTACFCVSETTLLKTGVADLGGGRSLAYELVLGPLVRYTSERKGTNRNTAVLIHGIMGSGRNMASFTRKLAHALPSWQFLLVDLRHHGRSVFQHSGSPNTVDAAARDVLDLVMKLKLFPRMLIGHSFGGKMVLSMLKQAAKPLPMHIQAWVLDAQPGELYLPKGAGDSPEELIDTLINHVPVPIMSKRDLVTRLKHFGFSSHVSQWVATNLRYRNGVDESDGYTWVFHLPGIYEMFHSYKTSNYWDIVEKPISGVHIHFLRGAQSDFRWPAKDVERLLAVAHESDGVNHAAVLHRSGISAHLLEGAGHWVHADNPDGLFRLLEPSFGVYDDTVII